MKILELKDVTFQYQGQRNRNKYILGPINVSLSTNSITGIAGKNGVGKTTLLLLFAGLLEPLEGHVHNLCNELTFGISFQNALHSLLPWKTVRQNIGFGSSTGYDSSQSIMQSFDFSQDAYPYQLSGGQQQMVNLARAFSMGKDVVLLDEPFSSLDYDNMLAVGRNLFQKGKQDDRAIVIVAHSLELQLAICDSILILGGTPIRIVGKINGVVSQDKEITFETSLSYAKDLVNEVRSKFKDFI